MILQVIRFIKSSLILAVISCHVSPIYAGLGENVGENFAAHMRIGLHQSSTEISHAIQMSARQINTSVQTALQKLDIMSQRLLKSADSNAAKLFTTIDLARKDLVRVVDNVTNSFDHGIDEIGTTLREAIYTAKRVATDLGNVVKTVGDKFENVTVVLKEVIFELTAAIDKTVDTLADTVKYVADKVLEVSKNFEVRINSGDLVSFAEETRQGLLDTLHELNRNWQVAINSADLKDVGKIAAAEMAMGLRNIQAKITVKVEIDDNTRQSIFYVSTSVGLVCCVFLCMIAKSCRNCISCMSTFIIRRLAVPRVNEDTGNKSDSDDGFGLKWSTGNYSTRAIRIQESKISPEEKNQKSEQASSTMPPTEYMAVNPAPNVCR